MGWGNYLILKESFVVEGENKTALAVFCSRMEKHELEYMLNDTDNIVQKLTEIYTTDEDILYDMTITQFLNEVPVGEIVKFLSKLYNIYTEILSNFSILKVLIDVLRLRGFDDIEIVSEEEITDKVEELEKEEWKVVEL